ncbi:PspC domain-containing protein [Bifidobacterium sp. CP2]|uniref:PspC domain-containing protein n=1 Tax=Bifidobacterium sp. CP2 TaxID=2809025 RepID=UPI001BDC278F|nr:PspC domain-containing protein [Bifidobacterium sp. CP2]MBT1181567.1 PspC domain-containing protein [Bifidobacterium sp. CP2]
MNDNDTTLRKRFFSWIRATGVMRGDDRWIGGVCSGFAARLGWSPTLVRALVLALTFLFGFGAALYAFGWLFLPDARDGRILAEGLLAGQWDWNCLGAFVFMAVALVIPGAGWVAFVAAGVALWAICQSGMRQRHGYGFAAQRPAGGAYAAPGQAPQGAPSPASGPWAAPQGAPVRPTSGPVPQGPAAPTMPAPTGAPVTPGPTMPMGAPVPPMRPAGPVAPPAPVPPAPHRPRTARRKPAGPMLVLLVLGLTMISGAGLYLYLHERYGSPSVTTAVTAAMVWIGAVCVAMGLLLVVLGVMGRRSGGLVPLALIAGFVAVCMMIATGSMSYAQYEAEHNRMGFVAVGLGTGGSPLSENADGTISLQGPVTGSLDGDAAYAPSSSDQTYLDPDINYWVSDSSPKNFALLQKGMYFQGMDESKSVANIDLSEYARWNYGGAQVNTYRKGCPAGQINLAVSNATVVVTLPDACPYTFGKDGLELYTGDVLGGANTVVLNNMVTSWGVPGTDYDYNDYADGTHQDNYDWQTNGIDDDSSFQINFASGSAGRVVVRYASESVLPSYVDYADRLSSNDWGDRFALGAVTKRHVAIQQGEQKDDGAEHAESDADGAAGGNGKTKDKGRSYDGTADGTKENDDE